MSGYDGLSSEVTVKRTFGIDDIEIVEQIEEVQGCLDAEGSPTRFSLKAQKMAP